MIRAGLTSVSFRKLTAERIVELAVQAGVAGIEWGGDVHVPHGDTGRAEAVAGLTRTNGLEVASYGSYYRAGDNGELSFDEVLASAVALGAPLIRVWAGRKGSAEADDAYRQGVVEDLTRIAQQAAACDVQIACEFHGNTLTDTNASAQALYRDVAPAGVTAYWQMPFGKPLGYCRQGLKALRPVLSNLHVQYIHVGPDRREFRPLADGETVWKSHLELVAGAPKNRWALVEFVAGNSPEQFLEDAATLKRWLHEVPSPGGRSGAAGTFVDDTLQKS